MTTKKEVKFEAKPLSGDDLPEQFRKFEKPLGLEQHVFNLIGFSVAHVMGAYWLFYLFPMGYVPRLSVAWWVAYAYFGGLGITVGAHRYWTHRSFKATMPLQVLMMIMQTSALQYPIFKWCRDHRVHHKYTDSMADPHSAGRGFWFSHILWLFQPKHPECVEKLKIVEVSDMARDPIISFQSKYYWELLILSFFIIPIGIGHLLFPTMSWEGLIAGNFLRFVLTLHITFLVNSVAHKYGDKPYDAGISPVQSKVVALFAAGEGWHNYHHTFPWDYRSSEFGIYYNLSNVFIHSFAFLGQAYDMKTVSQKMLIDRVNRTGDGSHHLHDHTAKLDEGDTSSRVCWGWGDENLKQEDVEITKTLFQSKTRSG